ncbi:MAG: MSCRAMM family protein, partial [Hyphomicrobiaceae bacterium]
MFGRSPSCRLSLPILAGVLLLFSAVGPNILLSHSAWAGECETPTAYENPHERKYGSNTSNLTKAHGNGHWDCKTDKQHEKKTKVEITIKKVAYGGNGKFRFHLNGPHTSENFMLSHGGETSFHLKPGTYAITEKYIPKGWRLDRIDCGQGKRTGNRIMVKLEPRVPVKCVFANRKKQMHKGRITVKKVTIGGNDEFKFALTGPQTNQMFTLTNGGETSFNLKRGTYAIEEKNLPEGWNLEQIDCGQGKRTGNRIMVKLDSKMPIECVFTNRKDDDPDDPGDPDEPKRFVKRRLDNLVSHEP